MNTFYSFSLFFCFIATSFGSETPTFSWIPNPRPVLQINYPNGLSDVAVLNNYNPIPLQSTERQEDVDTCIYDGYLSNESDVYVTLTGCAHTDTFNIQFRSQHLEHSMFKVVEGKVEGVESVFGRKMINREGVVESVTDVAEPIPALASGTLQRALNSTGSLARGYFATLKIRYDLNFRDRFGGDAVNTIRRIMAHAQNIWMWKSLTTAVLFDYQEGQIEPVSDKFAPVSTPLLENASRLSSTNYNLNLMLTFNNNQGGVIGTAWTGGVCSPDAKWRTALAEYFLDDMTSGENIAHEFGHNFNMQHDFSGSAGAMRRDSRGNACTNIGGVMDYNQKKVTWSSCSVEDFSALANGQSGSCLRRF